MNESNKYTRSLLICLLSHHVLHYEQKRKASLNAAYDRDSVNGLLRCDRVTKVYSEKIE